MKALDRSRFDPRPFGVRLLLVLAGVLMASVVAAQSPPSREFQVLLGQLQTYYFGPQGLDIRRAERDRPMLVAAALGHALRQQLLMAQADPRKTNYLRQVVEPESARHLQMIAARYRGYPGHRTADNRLLGPQDLLGSFGQSLQGGNDAFFAHNFGVRTAALPPVFVADGRTVGPRPGETPELPMVFSGGGAPPPQDNAIDLLGQRAPRVQLPPPLVVPAPRSSPPPSPPRPPGN
jgi:hypothetical protein